MAVAEPKTTPEKSSQYVDFDEFIEFQLKKTRTGIHHTDILSSAVVLCAVVLGYLFTFVIFDHWIVPGGVGYGVRVALLGLVVLGIGAWTVWKIVIPYMQQINVLFAAREIERSHPELKSSLLSLVDLRNSGKKISPHIMKALEKRTALEISHTNVDEAVDRRMLMRASYTLLAIVALLCAYTVFSPKNITTSLWRALFPTTSVAVSTRTNIVEVTPGNTEVLARDQVDITAELSGVIPEEATLFFSTADRRFVNEPIVMRNTGEGLPRFRGRLTGENGEGLLKEVTYHIVAGDTKSPTYTITVNQPPRADVTHIVYEYPAYMGLDRKVQDGANIDAWEGTWVTVQAQPNMELTRAMVLCSDEADGKIRAEEYPLTKKPDGTWEAKWQLKIRSDGTSPNFYHVQVWNEKEETDPLPTFHRIKIRPDLKPEITLIHPTKDMEAPLNAVIPIAFTCNDPDFMLRRVDLKLEKNGEMLPISPRLYMGPPYTSDFKTTYHLDLQKFKFQAGEQFSLYIQAQDNREPIDGISNDTTNSPKITITIIDPKPQEEVKQFEEQQRDELNNQIEQANEDAQQDRNPQEQNPADEKMQPRDDEENTKQESRENTEPGEASDMPQDGQNGTPQPSEGNEGEPQDGKPQEGSMPNKNQQPQEGTQPGEENSPDGNSSEEMQKPDGSTEKNETDQNGNPGEKNNGTKQNSGNEQKPGENANGQKPNDEKPDTDRQSKPRDKAADDEALKKLIEWNKEQQKKRDQEQRDNPSPEEDNTPKEKPGHPENSSQKPKTGEDPSPEQEPTPDQQENAAPKENGGSHENGNQNDPGQNKEMSPPEKGNESDPMKGENSSDQKNGSPSQDPAQEPTEQSPQPGDMKNDPMDGKNGESMNQKPGENSPENSSEKPSDSQPGQSPSKDDQKPGETTSDPSMNADDKPGSSENKSPSDSKPGDPTKSGEPMNPDSNDPAMQKEPGDATKPSDQKPGEMSPSKTDPSQAEKTPTDQPPGESDSKPGEPSEGQPKNGDPMNQKPGSQDPKEMQPGEQTQKDPKENGQPGDQKSSDGKPSDGKPTDGKPSDGKPTDGKPSDGKPSDGKPY